jgi:PTH1 family peptidyl-tRNA hydrolase
VIHDDLDISCGSIKYKLGGGSGGHNGIKSIDQHIGNMYHRIRIGIGKSEHIDTSNYVLSDSTKHEREAIDRAISIIAKSLPVIISHDFESFKHTVAIESKKSSIE